MRYKLRNPFVSDRAQKENNEDLLFAINEIAQFISFGDGAPTHTPTGRQIYIRRNGGAATTLYVWEGAAWVGK